MSKRIAGGLIYSLGNDPWVPEIAKNHKIGELPSGQFACTLRVAPRASRMSRASKLFDLKDEAIKETPGRFFRPNGANQLFDFKN